MCKIYSPIKQRVIEFLDKQDIRKEYFFSSTGIARPNFYGTNAKSELGGDKIIKILEAYSNLNPVWLLTGKGDMLLSDMHLVRENWITSDVKFHSINHSHEELLRVGTRIDEVCWQYGTTYKTLSQSVGISLSRLEKIIAGEQPAPKELLEKMVQRFPGLDLGWLFCGWGRMFTQEAWRTRYLAQDAIDEDIERYKEQLKKAQEVEEQEVAIAQSEQEERLQEQVAQMEKDCPHMLTQPKVRKPKKNT
jgi:hypothetical protein